MSLRGRTGPDEQPNGLAAAQHRARKTVRPRDALVTVWWRERRIALIPQNRNVNNGFWPPS
jgi:hypothetical protein